MRIAGSVAVVTGGLSGLGLASARKLVAAGCTVVVTGRPRSNASEILGDLPDMRFIPADVTSEQQIADVLDAAESIGPVRALVHCAGINEPGRLVGRNGPLPLDGIRHVVEVNLVGTVNVLRLTAARMRRYEPLDGDRGVLVCTSSIAAYDGQLGQALYAATKGAIASLTLPLARELAASAVRVVTVAPGFFDTPMLAGVPDRHRDALLDQVPHPRRLGRSEEFADLVAHIVENSMLNGEVIRLDGAARMAPR